VSHPQNAWRQLTFKTGQAYVAARSVGRKPLRRQNFLSSRRARTRLSLSHAVIFPAVGTHRWRSLDTFAAHQRAGRHVNPFDALPTEAKARLRKMPQPEWVAPTLARVTQERFSREGWLFEPKWDGERCIAVRRGHKLSLFSRNRIVLNAKYPEIASALDRQEAVSFIADGEIVTFKDGITSFAKLQQHMQVDHPSTDLLRRVPVCLYLFDVLYFDHYDTRKVPLRYRKKLLRNSFDFKGSLRFTNHREIEGEVYYREAASADGKA
jgi:ATP-dependent DNA ligase